MHDVDNDQQISVEIDSLNKEENEKTKWKFQMS